MPLFIVSNWYWNVTTGPTGQVYSSASASYVPTTNTAYEAWLAQGNTPTTIATLTDLIDYLNDAYPLGTPYGVFIEGGVTVTSTSTPALNGLYPIDADTQTNITTEASFINTFSEFTTGGTTNLPWQLSNGTFIEWPTTTEFMAFAKAVGQLVASAKLAAAQGNAMPAATITLP